MGRRRQFRAALPPDLLPMPVGALEDELKGLDTKLRDWILLLVGVVNYVASSGKVKPVWQNLTSAQKSFLVRLQDDMKIFMERHQKIGFKEAKAHWVKCASTMPGSL